MSKNVVGARIRQARKMAEPPITQIDLAARLQVLGLKIDQATVSKIEQGYRPVFDYELVKLAEVLKVSVAWLLGEADVSTESSTE